MKKLLLFLLLSPLALCGQSFQAELGAVLSGSEVRDKFALPPSRIMLKYGATIGKFSFFDVQNKVGYQGFSVGNNRAFQIGEFRDYVNFTDTRVLTSEVKVSQDQKISIHGFVSAANKFFVLYSVNDKAQNKEYVYVNELSRSMQALGTPLLLMTFDEKKSIDSPIYFTTSPDKKTYAIVREYKDRGTTERIEIKAFNQHFGELYKTAVDVAAMEDHFVCQDVAIADNHNLYLFGKVDPRAKRLVVMGGAKSKAIPLVIAYEAQTKKTRQVAIAEPGIKQYYDSRFFLTPANEPIAVSIFKSGKEVGYKVCHLENERLNHSGVLSAKAKAIAGKYRSEKSFLEVSNLQQLASGEYVVSLESNYTTANRNRSFSNSGSVILLGLDQQGGKLWENIIYKQQKIPDTKMFSSHRSVVTPSGMLVIYNEHEKNVGLDPASARFSKLKKLKHSVPVAVEVNARGEMKKYPLYKNPELAGYSLDTYHLLEIEKGQYQFKIVKDPMFGKYQTAYGKLGIH